MINNIKTIVYHQTLGAILRTHPNDLYFKLINVFNNSPIIYVFLQIY
jgi:hypothetical protein